MHVTTSSKTANNGTAQVVARFGNKQKTVNVDSSHSENWNHGTAAAMLLLHVLTTIPGQTVSALVRSIDEGYSTHVDKGNGRHVFDI